MSVNVTKRCGFPFVRKDKQYFCEGSNGHIGECWSQNAKTGAMTLASGEEAGKILKDTGHEVELCPDCDMLLPYGAPPGRCDHCELTYKRTQPNKIFDAVDKPAHYNLGDIEAIDAIREMLGGAGFRQYCRGQVMKYLWRAPYKGAYDQDLKKALWYLKQACGEDPRER